MIQTLNFVRGAVATKDLIPILTSFHIYDGKIQGSNGKMSIEAPCPSLKGFDFTIEAPLFLKAVDSCNGEPKMVVQGSFLQISRGSFKAKLPLGSHNDFPRQMPAGEEGVGLSNKLLPSLKFLHPFIGEDASRAWACGILFRGGMAFATNNVIVAGAPAIEFEESLNLPGFLINELLRLGQEPQKVVACENSITFTFVNGSWIKSTLLSAEWPAVEKMLPEGVGLSPVPSGLLQAVESITPFCPDPKLPLIYFSPEGVKTAGGDKSAHIEGFNLPESTYRSETLCKVLKSATHADFTAYPKPVPWTGPNGLKGLLVGVK